MHPSSNGKVYTAFNTYNKIFTFTKDSSTCPPGLACMIGFSNPDENVYIDSIILYKVPFIRPAKTQFEITDPLSFDTHNQGMPDRKYCVYNHNWCNDEDDDFLSNKEEYGLKTEMTDEDTDDDGIWDGIEVNGVKPYWKNKDPSKVSSARDINEKIDGTSANPFVKDIFLEVDWQKGYAFSEDIYIGVKDAFETDSRNNGKSIILHIDKGRDGGGEELPTYETQEEHFTSDRKGVFHYMIITDCGGDTNSHNDCENIPWGLSDVPGDSIHIYKEKIDLKLSSIPDKDKVFYYKRTILHELGHNIIGKISPSSDSCREVVPGCMQPDIHDRYECCLMWPDIAWELRYVANRWKQINTGGIEKSLIFPPKSEDQQP